MTAWYNEHDPYAAQWLRNLIAAGHIAPGIVDERDIRDVRPSDLDGYVQCHLFAGAGVWSYAARLAGWPDDRPLWTGSCPCQPFSAAGRGGGFDDERHLWPAFFHLIDQCRPPVVLGEQVASKDGLGWLDLVHSNLEAADYAFGAVDMGAASVGAPHIRQRLWWVAHAPGREQRRLRERGAGDGWRELPDRGHSATRLLADTEYGGCQGRQPAGGRSSPTMSPGFVGGVAHTNGGDAGAERQSACGKYGQQSRDGFVGGMGDANGRQRDGLSVLQGAECDGQDAGWSQGGGEPSASGDVLRPGPTNGFWRDADWLRCRDGKWRPVEPGTFPLAHGVAARVGKLRAAGNAIVAPLAAEFIGAVADAVWLTAVSDLSDDMRLFG